MTKRVIKREGVAAIVTKMPRGSMVVRIHYDDCADKFSRELKTLRGQVVAVRSFWRRAVKPGDWVNFKYSWDKSRGQWIQPEIIDLDRIGLGRYVVAPVKNVVVCVHGGMTVDFETQEED